MLHREIVLAPEWLPHEGGHHGFQEALRTISQASEEALVIHAPTGAGKTFALRQWLRDHPGPLDDGLLVVAPTNALAQEIHDDLARIVGEMPGCTIHRWAAAAIRERAQGSPTPRHHQLSAEALAKVIVTNPDVLHRLLQHEYAPNAARWRPAWSRFEGAGLIVIDEYHAYDEQLLASILLAILRLRHLQRPPKFAFLSATPNESLIVLLRNLGITHRVINESTQHDEMPPSKGRQVRGRIHVRVTNQPILEAVPTGAPARRTLFVFNKFGDLQRAITRVRGAMPIGNVEGGFVPITGRSTRADHGQLPFDRGSLLLATSKVDVGLNIPSVEEFHIEPGWDLSQAWQRIGRAGRGEQDAVVTLHLGCDDATLAQFPLSSLDDLRRMLAALYKDRSIRAPRVQCWMGRYVAAYEASTTANPAHRAVTIEHVSAGCEKARQEHALTHVILGERFAELTGDAGDYTETWWQDQVKLSLATLRGRRLEAWAHYPGLHAEGEATRDDLLYLLSNTEQTPEVWPNSDGESRTVHVVRRIFDKPGPCLVSLPMMAKQTFHVSLPGNFVPDDVWRTYVCRIRGFPSGPDKARFREALADWLACVGPGAIPFVEAVRDDIFL